MPARPRPSACPAPIGRAVPKRRGHARSGIGCGEICAEQCARHRAVHLVQSLQPDMKVEQLVQQTRALVAAQHMPLALKLLERHKKVRRRAARLGFKAVPLCV